MWTMPLRNWGKVYGELSIMYAGISWVNSPLTCQHFGAIINYGRKAQEWLALSEEPWRVLYFRFICRC